MTGLNDDKRDPDPGHVSTLWGTAQGVINPAGDVIRERHKHKRATIIWSVLTLVGFVLCGAVAVGLISGKMSWSKVAADEIELHYVNPILLIILLAGTIVCLVGAYWCLSPSNSHSSETPSSSNEYTGTPTVNILMPADTSDSSPRGDSLLQAAGFLAAREACNGLVDIKFFNHKNDSRTAAELVKQVIAEYIDDNSTPICFIVTMSRVSKAVLQTLEDKTREFPELADRLSVVFTVTSGSWKELAQGNNYYFHFVEGIAESRKIQDHCENEISTRDGQGNVDVSILYYDSSYPRNAAEALDSSLGEGFTKTKRVIDINGKTAGWDEGEGARICRSQVIVVLAYDHSLFGVIKLLAEQEYDGVLIGSTPLSVPDWQDYLAKRNIHLRGEVRCTELQDFSESNPSCVDFITKLEPWDFKKVTSVEEIWGRGADSVRNEFTDLEKEIYKSIKPNYISAFCFDTLRLYAQMARQHKRVLHDVNLSNELCPIGMHSPFGDVDFRADGRSVFTLAIPVITQISNRTVSSEAAIEKDVLVVVDVQKDFCAGGALAVDGADVLINGINQVIKQAEKLGYDIIYTRDWHPANHGSFKLHDGPWPVHCVHDTLGAEYHDDLYLSPGYNEVKTGQEPEMEGYSPYEDPDMDDLIENARRIFVVGIALEYCVRATVLDSIKRACKPVIVFKPLVASLGTAFDVKRTWNELKAEGAEVREKIDFS